MMTLPFFRNNHLTWLPGIFNSLGGYIGIFDQKLRHESINGILSDGFQKETESYDFCPVTKGESGLDRKISIPDGQEGLMAEFSACAWSRHVHEA